MTRNLAIAVLVTGCTLWAYARADTPSVNLAAFNLAENASFPLTNEALPFAREGWPAYDCKGFTALKARGLHQLGISYDRMNVLLVNGGRHMVLEVDGQVLDDASNWLQSPGDYPDARKTPIQLLIVQMGMTP